MATATYSAALAQATCFDKYNDYLETSGTPKALDWQPCRVPLTPTDYVSCCVGGDLCLSNNVCYFQHPPGQNNNNNTGYYKAGCTDSAYKDATCLDHCTNVGAPDIVYFSVNNTWSCCDSYHDTDPNNWSCASPGGENFSLNQTGPLSTIARAAVTPGQTPLIIATEYPASASRTIYPSSTATTFPTQPASATQTLSDTGLSNGAKAGVGVGVAVAVVIILIVVGFFIWRWRKRRAARFGNAAKLDDQSKHEQYSLQEVHGYDLKPHAPQEIHGNEVRSEAAGRALHEIGGSEVRR